MWNAHDILRALRGERATILKEWRAEAQRALWHLDSNRLARRGPLTLCAEATLGTVIQSFEAQISPDIFTESGEPALGCWIEAELSWSDVLSLMDLLHQEVRRAMLRRDADPKTLALVDGQIAALRAVIAEERVRHVEQELANVREELANTQILTGRYLANLTHDIRTPLTAVLGFSELLLEGHYGTLAAEQRAAVGYVENSARNLEEILNNMFDLMQIRAGKFTVQLRSLPAAPLLNYLCDLLRPLADRKEVHFEVIIPESIGTIEGDQHLVSHIVYHLLASCMRATPAGGTVRMEAQRKEGGLHLIVKDTAFALPPDIVETMRNPYLLRENVSVRGYDYWEVGLPLVQRYVDLHRGTLSITSAQGDGTTFHICLPLS
jgi:cell cycle sensor histidine kinase DivJ